MVEPLPCVACPNCHAETVIALRTAQMSNFCHCSSCGYVWNDENPQLAPVAEVTVRRKPDRRRVWNAQ